MRSALKKRKLKEPIIAVLKDEVQTTLIDLPTTLARKKVAMIPIDIESFSQQERSKLETRYRELIEHRLDWRQLVTYVPNKKLPLYNWFKYKEGFSRDLVTRLFKEFAVQSLLRTIYAEAGSEWQGTWVNNIGQLAAQELQQVVVEFAEQKNLVDRHKTEQAAEEGNYLVLKSGTKLCFGSEPDVECRSKAGELVCVIEIKGRADKAGAQTRLGETKKSFTKAKLENPRCHTIFLPSVQTPSVLKQLKTERDIDQVFDLLAILRNKLKRSEFLEELFKFRLREKI
jgi:hypothetical protein